MAGKPATTAASAPPADRARPHFAFGQTEIVVIDGTPWPECYAPKPKAKNSRCGKAAAVGQRTGSGYTWRCEGCNGGAKSLPLVQDSPAG